MNSHLLLAAHLQFAVSDRTSSLVVFQRTPLCRFSRLRPVLLPISKDGLLRPNAAKRRTPSAFAVPPGSDGLLRMRTCKFIAPCFRPWGSSGFVFGLARDAFPLRSLLQSFLTLAFIPSEAFPSPIAAPRHRVAFPSRRSTLTPFPVCLQATSGPYSIAKSVSFRSVSTSSSSMLPWALFLFKVLPSPRVLK